MKPKYNFAGLILLSILPFIILCFTGCFPDRVVTEPDYEAQDVRRPDVEHHVPLGDATEVNRSTTITIWFDELMNTASVQNNFFLWPSVKMDSIQVVAVNPSNPEIIYAAKSGTGIFKSEDAAESWQWLNPGSMKMVFTELVVCQGNSDVLYAATVDSGVCKSSDGGNIWRQLNSGLPEMNITAIAVDPVNDAVIYAVTSSNGIYKSEDGGLSWNAKNTGVRTTRPPRDIAINPMNSNSVYAATQGDFILHSIDGGENWSRLRTGFFTFNFNIIAIHPQDTSLVFTVSDGGGIYRSKDSGTNWELIVEGLTSLNIQSLAVHPRDTNILIISTASGFFKSLDSGDKWISCGDIPTEAVVSILAIDPVLAERLFAGTTMGIYRSEDLGDSWIERNNLPKDDLYVTGLFNFETWQDSTTIITPLNSTGMDTSVIFPDIYERALEGWIARGRQGEPPVDPNPIATKMIFTPNRILLPNLKYQVRIMGSFESDCETLKGSYGAEDISGNSLEVKDKFTFTTGK